MWRVVVAGAMSLPVIGCADANAATFDSSDPVSCMVIFGIAANGAKQAAQHTVVNEMVGRASFLAAQNGGVEWIQKIGPQSMEIAKKMEAAQDKRATFELLDQCVAQQDADPAFRASLTKP